MSGRSGSRRASQAVVGGAGTPQLRLAWQTGDGQFQANSWVVPPVNSWRELDLGVVTVPPAVAGTQKWTGRIEASSTAAGDLLHIDYLVLVPVTAGYGKARASYSYKPGVAIGYDDFAGTTAGAALNARVAPTGGGTWATSGDATDFAAADDLSGEQVKRATTSATVGRFAILGATNYTDTEVSALVQDTLGISAGATVTLGVIARWVNSTNYLRADLTVTRAAVGPPVTTATLNLTKLTTAAGQVLLSSTVVSGKTALGSTSLGNVLRLIVYPTGRAFAQLCDTTGTVVIDQVEAQHDDLATGGTLATGKPGLYDSSTSANAVTRYYDNFQVATPAAEPILIFPGRRLEITGSDVLREDATGTYWGRPPSYRGSRFVVPVGTSRVFVKARRNDVEAGADDGTFAPISVQTSFEGRGLVVPRA
jgi:hypothetical protein